jgi:SAM-dependent methyltransferase
LIESSKLEDWPGGERREPPRSDRHYLILKPLADQIQAEASRLLSGRTDAAILDVGCGQKPYLPLLASYAERYVGVDSAPGPQVDQVAAAESLPFEDEGFDLVLCTQVLEHVQDPAATLKEIHRVLKPGAGVLVSTHGVFLYHPDPPDSDQDYWRWTHAGLEKTIRSCGSWEEVTLQANGDLVSCIAYLGAQFVDELGRRAGPDRLRKGALRALNSAAERLDRRFPPNARFPRPGSLSANYLATAVKAPALSD